jgi:hypothetical protein
MPIRSLVIFDTCPLECDGYTSKTTQLRPATAIAQPDGELTATFDRSPGLLSRRTRTHTDERKDDRPPGDTSRNSDLVYVA